MTTIGQWSYDSNEKLYKLYPFDLLDDNMLCCLSSRVTSPPETEEDILHAEQRGERSQKVLHRRQT